MRTIVNIEAEREPVREVSVHLDALETGLAEGVNLAPIDVAA